MKNNYSVWYNARGVDTCYGEVEGDKFDKDVLKGLSKKFYELDVVELDDFDVEVEGENWTMYAYDGTGIFEVDDFDVEVEGENWTMYAYDGTGIFEVRGGRSVDECKKEYDEIIGE